MKFFKFMESKFTEHSLNQQVEEFSILKDGEQKATQTFMNTARTLAKWWAIFKLPMHFVACSVGLVKWPVTADLAIKEFTERKQAEAKKATLEALNNQEKGPDKVLSISKQAKE